MATEEEIEANLLMFLEKSFGFERSVEVAHREYAVFARTETESESQFRPRLVRLRVVVPKEWLLFDLAADALLIAPDGHTPGPQHAKAAREAAADAPEFVEHGVEWHRRGPEKGKVLYVPGRHASELLSAAGLAALDSPS